MTKTPLAQITYRCFLGVLAPSVLLIWFLPETADECKSTQGQFVAACWLISVILYTSILIYEWYKKQ